MHSIADNGNRYFPNESRRRSSSFHEWSGQRYVKGGELITINRFPVIRRKCWSVLLIDVSRSAISITRIFIPLTRGRSRA